MSKSDLWPLWFRLTWTWLHFFFFPAVNINKLQVYGVLFSFMFHTNLIHQIKGSMYILVSFLLFLWLSFRCWNHAIGIQTSQNISVWVWSHFDVNSTVSTGTFSNSHIVPAAPKAKFQIPECELKSVMRQTQMVPLSKSVCVCHTGHFRNAITGQPGLEKILK